MNNAIRTTSILILLVAIAACGKEESAQDHIANANQFISASDYDSAVIELKNALQKENQSAEARWLLGKTYLESGDVLSAEKELQRAMDLGWPHSEVLPAIAKTYIAQNKYAETLKLQARGLEPAADASLLASKALAALALGENRKARRLANSALEKSPESTGALMARAQIFASLGDLAGAEKVLERLLALDPENVAAWSLTGDIRSAQQQLDEALLAYNRAIELKGDDYNSLFRRALLNLQLRDYEASQADTSTLLGVAPQHTGANYIQGAMHFQAGRYAEAITSLSVAEPAYQQFPLLLFFLGSAHLVEGHLDQAGIQATRYHEIAPESVRGRKLLGTIRLKQDKYQQVQELIRPVLDTNPDDIGALNLMSNALLRDGKTDEGIALLARVAELQPDSPVAQVRLGAGLLAGGKDSDAAQHIEAALELDPEFQQGDILLIMNHLRNKEYEAAIEAAQAYRRRHLTSTTPLNLLGRAYLEAGQIDEAKASFEKALSFEPGDPAANHNLAQMAITNKDLARARQYYATILDHHEDYLPALIQLGLLDVEEENEALLIDHMEQGMTAHPEAIEPRLLLGRYYLSEGRAEKVAPLFADMAEAQKQTPKVLRLIALSQLSQKEHSEAQYTLEQLMEAIPDTASLHHLMAMAASGSGDEQRAEQELALALELDENYLPSIIALAKLSLRKGRASEFAQQIEKLESVAPQNPEVMLLRAAFASRKGDTTSAVKLAEQSFELSPGTLSLLALGSYLEAASDREGSIALYRGWLDENPEDVTARLALANSLQLSNEIKEATVHYERVLKLDPDSVPALNNLAWYTREENPEKALKYARHASRIAPNSAEVLDTLAVVEYLNEDYKQAQRSAERALELNPDHPSLIYHSAMISAARGDTTAAINTLEELLGRGSKFPEIEEATALLAELRK